MGESKKFKFFISALAIVVASSFAGTVSGTVAWFAYSTRATLTYSGTSINESELIQVGLVCENDYWAGYDAASTLANHNEVKEKYELTYEYVDGKVIYFAPVGRGIKSNAVKAYLQKTGYAVDKLEPITSRYYDLDIADDHVGNNLSLYRAPMKEYPLNTTAASKSQYSKLRLAFRVLTSNELSATYAEGQNVWLTGVNPRAEGEGNIVNALRVYVDGSQSSCKKYILNPTQTSNGQTAVAGLLNLSGDDQFYDVDNGEEIIYGDYDGSLPTTPLADSSDLADINGTGGSTASTFLAKHEGGNDVYNYTAEQFKAGILPKYAQYVGTNVVYPDDDSQGNLAGGLPICVTKTDADNTKRLGYADFTIYLEGWDHAVIDEELNHAFNLQLLFQINKL